VLAGGWYFATETARVLGGLGSALTPEEGAALLRDRMISGLPRPEAEVAIRTRGRMPRGGHSS
jgi:hypothetical protein